MSKSPRRKSPPSRRAEVASEGQLPQTPRLSRIQFRADVFHDPAAQSYFVANQTPYSRVVIDTWQDIIADVDAVDSLVAAVEAERKRGILVDGLQIEYVELEGQAARVDPRDALYRVLIAFLESFQPCELLLAGGKLRVTIFLSRLPLGWNNVDVKKPPVEQGKSSIAEALEAELTEAQAPVVARIRDWVRSLANMHFERKEQAQELVHTLTHLVRRSGHQLIYEGQAVTLAVVLTTRQKRPSIEVRGRVDGKQKPLRCSTEMPEFSIRPLP